MSTLESRCAAALPGGRESRPASRRLAIVMLVPMFLAGLCASARAQVVPVTPELPDCSGREFVRTVYSGDTYRCTTLGSPDAWGFDPPLQPDEEIHLSFEFTDCCAECCSRCCSLGEPSCECDTWIGFGAQWRIEDQRGTQLNWDNGARGGGTQDGYWTDVMGDRGAAGVCGNPTKFEIEALTSNNACWKARADVYRRIGWNQAGTNLGSATLLDGTTQWCGSFNEAPCGGGGWGGFALECRPDDTPCTTSHYWRVELAPGDKIHVALRLSTGAYGGTVVNLYLHDATGQRLRTLADRFVSDVPREWRLTYQHSLPAGTYYLSLDPGFSWSPDRHLNDLWEYGAAFTVERTAPVISLDLAIAAQPALVTQVVPNVDINADGHLDLVAGRAALLTARVVATGVNPADTRPVTVHLVVPGRADPVLPWKSPTLPINALASPGADVEFLFTPATTGPQSLQVVVDPGPPSEGAIAERDEANNQREMQVDVKPTLSLTVGYIRVRSPAPLQTLVPDDVYETMSEDATLFMKATFPASDVIADINFNTVRAVADPSTVGLAEDVRKVTAALIRSNDRAAGIVADDYFPYHGRPNCVGVTFFGALGVLSTSGDWATPAHELGHSFGLALDEEEYQVGPDGSIVYLGDPVSGFFVPHPFGPGTIEIKDRTCFMGAAVGNDNWIALDHFSDLFRTFLVNPADPEVLVVTGLLWRDGRVDLRPWYFLQEGVATTSQEGNYAVRVLDGAGQVLSETGLLVSFQLAAEPLGIEPTDVVPLVVKVPFPSSAERVQILKEGQVVVTTEPLGKLLRDAVAALPDGVFGSVVERRTALLRQAEAIQKMLDGGRFFPALTVLQREFRPTVERWLVAGQTPDDALATTKEGLLQLVDAIIARLPPRN